jgi:hypothetical protein
MKFEITAEELSESIMDSLEKRWNIADASEIAQSYFNHQIRETVSDIVDSLSYLEVRELIIRGVSDEMSTRVNTAMNVIAQSMDL